MFVKFVKFVASGWQCRAFISAPGESGDSKTYSQLAAHVRAISEQIRQRFMESGEDTEGD